MFFSFFDRLDLSFSVVAVKIVKKKDRETYNVKTIKMPRDDKSVLRNHLLDSTAFH